MNNKTFDLALLVLRMVLGITMALHGAQKVGLLGDGSIQQTVEAMGKGGIPAVLAYCAIAAEFLGGIGLILGFLGRIAALGILITMSVAVFKVHLSSGFFAQDGGYEFPFVLAGIALALLLTGMGRLSLDAKMSGRGRSEGA